MKKIIKKEIPSTQKRGYLDQKTEIIILLLSLSLLLFLFKPIIDNAIFHKYEMTLIIKDWVTLNLKPN